VNRQPGLAIDVVRAMAAFVTLNPIYSMPYVMQDQAFLTLDRFLAEVQLKAFRIAQSSLRHEQDALDAVQEAMLQLARRYANRPAEEWKPLFYRILTNKIRDTQRRRKVRGKVMAWLPFFRDESESEQPDPVQQMPEWRPEPGKALELNEAVNALEQALRALPPRQQQVFMLRNLEGLDVAQTAKIMGCSAGSVKTHYFRALHTLRAALGEHHE
jgi:RNA polymerase sigma-70 factor, ECF subfamily